MKKYKKISGILVGNTMEFYDFTIYAFLATYISKEFFNFDNQFLSYLVVFGIFASGYLTRPLGALLFGYIGDRHGRSKALSISIIISTIATFSIGLIPGYESIGISSSFILISLRLLQGLAVSGEGGAIVLLFEKYSFNDKGLIGGSILSSTLTGVLLGSIVCALTSWSLSAGEMSEWIWRLPFLLSLPFGIVAVLLRYLLNDFQLFQLAEKKDLTTKKPVVILLKNYSRTILYSIGIVSLYSITTSTLIVHFPYLLTEKAGLTHYSSLLILTALLAMIAVVTPLLGKLLSSYDPLRVYRISGLTLAIISPCFFYCISIGNLQLILLTAVIFSLLIACISAVLFPIFVGIFPFGVRYSGVAFSFNLSITLFSSSTPLIMLFLERYWDSLIIAGGYISIFTILALFLSQSLIKDKTIVYFNQTEGELALYGNSVVH